MLQATELLLQIPYQVTHAVTDRVELTRRARKITCKPRPFMVYGAQTKVQRNRAGLTNLSIADTFATNLFAHEHCLVAETSLRSGREADGNAKRSPQ